MESYDISRQVAIYYVIGILIAAVIFRVVRARRLKRKDERRPFL
ncbi:MAG: hypothetical protein V3U35_02665 [Candidatus Neomarinimicrobiota bacterium]